MRFHLISTSLLVTLVVPASPQDCAVDGDFVNWETPHVHPLELSADGSLILAVNTPDARLEVFDPTQDPPLLLFEVTVGLDPVSVRRRNATEAWVVNHVSDSISVVDLATARVRATLDTADEPCDVVFAGEPKRAFVSCSQANLVQVFDPSNLSAPPNEVPIEAEDPRALAVSPDGSQVYVAIFESGNASTILGGGAIANLGFPPNVVNDSQGPYGGQNPPPNDGNQFKPPLNPNNPPPPAVGLIVKKDDAGRWMDDNGGDWTDLVSGAQADRSGRPVGWDMPDRDVAVIDAGSLIVTYESRLMNICMALGVNPVTGQVGVVGTDATNEVRYEPLLRGVFLRVQLGLVDPDGVLPRVVKDLNPQLDYTTGNIPISEREQSIGDPRGIAWNAAGSRAYVTGMGSNNMVVLDASGRRVGQAPTIEVGEGPTGVVLDDARQRLYVLNKFASTISVVDVASELQIHEVPFFDPSPSAIKLGRRPFYDTHATSGLGHIACASCHVDSRLDRIAWDLGDPAGEMKTFNQNCPDNGCQDWHPMKGPMLTQTLQDIIGKEPHHWRGDREGIEAFGPAFSSLMGADGRLTAQQMQEFEDFLATIHFPPNPFRKLNNTLPKNLPLPGHFTPGRFGQPGLPLPDGNAIRGLALFRPPNLLDAGVLACVTCHTLPLGMGTDHALVGGQFVPIPPGPNGERHHALVSVDGSTNISMKIPQLRNLYDRVGFDATQLSNPSGFGFLHDGSVDSIARFVAEPVFAVQSVQDVADLVAFMLAFSGSDLPQGSTTNLLEPPGTASQDAHAAVGVQTTLIDAATAPQAQLDRIQNLVALAEAGSVGVVVKGRQSALARGWSYVIGGSFQSDRLVESATLAQLLAAAAPGSELTFTAVPLGTEVRVGIDRDRDGHFDRDELDAGTDPADCTDFPGSDEIGDPYCDPNVPNTTGLPADISAFGSDLAADGDLTLVATQMPPNQFGYFLASQTQGFVPNPGGSSGNLCLGGSIGRFRKQIQNSGPAGTFSIVVDTANIPTSPPSVIHPGETWNFQCWFRDSGTSNFSDGVQILFQ